MPPRKLTAEQEAARARVIATMSAPPIEPPEDTPEARQRERRAGGGTGAQIQAARRIARIREMADDAERALHGADDVECERAVEWARVAWFSLSAEDEQFSAIGALLLAIDHTAQEIVAGTVQRDRDGQVRADLDGLGVPVSDFVASMAIADVINRFDAVHADYADKLRAGAGRLLLAEAIGAAVDVWRSNHGAGKNRWEPARKLLGFLFGPAALPADLGAAYLQWRKKRSVELQESVPVPVRNKPGKRREI